MLDIVASYHCMQCQGKLRKQNSENDKKPSFRPDFCPFLPNSDCHSFSQKSGFVITRYNGQLSSCTLSEKTNDPMLRKLSDGQTDRQQTDESDFIGRYPTNVERPKSVFCIL